MTGLDYLQQQHPPVEGVPPPGCCATTGRAVLESRFRSVLVGMEDSFAWAGAAMEPTAIPAKSNKTNGVSFITQSLKEKPPYSLHSRGESRLLSREG